MTLTPAQRVARSRRRALEAGARRLNAILPAESAALLDTLVRRHGTITEALVRAIEREAAAGGAFDLDPAADR